ncbi:hypothetical protein FB451DRAFT_1168218 [Mycena latifolia]|nr:hypothetical protein FB451DRAFT_1168218 [Mycena latifolia]
MADVPKAKDKNRDRGDGDERSIPPFHTGTARKPAVDLVTQSCGTGSRCRWAQRGQQICADSVPASMRSTVSVAVVHTDDKFCRCRTMPVDVSYHSEKCLSRVVDMVVKELKKEYKRV